MRKGGPRQRRVRGWSRRREGGRRRRGVQGRMRRRRSERGGGGVCERRPCDPTRRGWLPRGVTRGFGARGLDGFWARNPRQAGLPNRHETGHGGA
uniref:Uncharacterized protein n=1 Tax=Arundo donax TaxID=35708 RepID=A0A0A9G2C8_ARUDO